MTGNILDVIETPDNNEREAMTITAIQKMLMCESAMISTSSSITMSGTPPAYSTAVSFLLRLSCLFYKLALFVFFNP